LSSSVRREGEREREGGREDEVVLEEEGSRSEVRMERRRETRA